MTRTRKALVVTAGDPAGIGPEWEEESAQDGITNVSFETLAAAREAAETVHQQLLGTISKLDSANLEVSFKHYIFGPMNAREWAIFQRIHDGDHIAQLRTTISAILAR